MDRGTARGSRLAAALWCCATGAALVGCAAPPIRQGADPRYAIAPLHGLEMQRIPGGIFRLGNNAGDESARPAHLEIIRPFRLGRYEITYGQFAEFVQASGYQTSAELNHGAAPGCAEKTAAGMQYVAGRSWRDPGFSQTDRSPAVCVSYNDMQAFISWLNVRSGHYFRLPSETEWEYAARAGSTSAYPWGDDPARACEFEHVAPAAGSDAATTGEAGGGTHCAATFPNTAPVGSYRANRFELQDMLGNVREQVQDCWHPSYNGVPTNGTAWETECDGDERVVRGGAWNLPVPTSAGGRGSAASKESANNRGFRIAESLH